MSPAGAGRNDGELPAHAEGFLLAGGQSSRMGREKALIEFAGEPLIARAAGILRRAGLAVRIAGARVALESFAPVIADADPGMGPLSGIVAALASLPPQVRWAAFLPIDLPLLPSALVACLLRYAQVRQPIVALCSVSGFVQTFPAVIDRCALPFLQNELKAGRRGCYASFQTAAEHLGQKIDVIAVEFLAQPGQVLDSCGLPTLRWFTNVNSPKDLHLAECLKRVE